MLILEADFIATTRQTHERTHNREKMSEGGGHLAKCASRCQAFQRIGGTS